MIDFDYKSIFCQYFRMQKIKEAKVVIVGDMGVGKTSLAVRYSTDKFSNFQESTLGAAYIEKVQKTQFGQGIKFQIWDTAGQEKFRSIAKLYYRDSKVAILVFDITRQSTLQSLKKWVEDVVKHVPKNCILVLVGTKSDLINEDENYQINKVYEAGMRYSKQIGAIFKLTSSKENKGIAQLFSYVAETVFKQDCAHEESTQSSGNDLAKQKRRLSKKKSSKKKESCC